MRLTIGMPSAGGHEEVWFVVQALRLYQDLRDVEILVVDNVGNETVEKVCRDLRVRCVRFTGVRGTAAAKNRVFGAAESEWVICMDSHVFLAPGAVAAFKTWAAANANCGDLLHGPLVYDDGTTADAMNNEWGTDGLWGTWRTRPVEPSAVPYEIPMHGCGLMASRRPAWLGFNPQFTGFGGEEGYIHAKYRKAGRRVMLLPFLRWHHRFRQAGEHTNAYREHTIRNYVIGAREVGFDITPLRKRFPLVRTIEASLPAPLGNVENPCNT